MLSFAENFLLGVSFAAASPGPVTIEMIKRGLRSGFLPAFLVGLGAACADALLLTLGYFGLASFISIPAVKKIVWILGALVLSFMAHSSLTKRFSSASLESKKHAPSNSLLAGFTIAATSPITIVWWASVAGTTLSSENTASLAALSSNFTIILGIISGFAVLSLALNYSKKLVNEKTMQRISILSAIAFLAFAAYFAYNAIVS